MELTVSKRVLFAGLAALLILAGAGVLIGRIKVGTSQANGAATHLPPTAFPSQTPPGHLTDDAAMEVARQALVAYFSIDLKDQAGWVQAMTSVSDDAETVGMLESAVWPEISRDNVMSKPSSVVVRKVLEGYDTVAHRRWQVWEAQVFGLSSWPAPAPEPMGPFAIPWATGNEVSLYVTVFEGDGRWRFGLFPVSGLVAEQIRAAATSQPLGRGQQ